MIDMGGASVAGDGILLAGHTLFAVRNQDHVAVIDLAPDLSSGTIVDQLTGDFDVPTTVARHRVVAVRRQRGLPPTGCSPGDGVLGDTDRQVRGREPPVRPAGAPCTRRRRRAGRRTSRRSSRTPRRRPRCAGMRFDVSPCAASSREPSEGGSECTGVPLGANAGEPIEMAALLLVADLEQRDRQLLVRVGELVTPMISRSFASSSRCCS